MKKMIFLMLVFFLGISAGTNAQVNIGSEDAPKDGAILDLSRSGKKLGLILPNVRLENVSTWQLAAGDGSDAAGTVVFNTNADLKDALETNTLGQGIFVWNGNGWQAAKGGTGEVLAKDFTLKSGENTVTDGSTITLWTGGTKSFAVEAASFIPTSAEVAKGVKWVISPASFAAIQEGSTNTACVVEGVAEGITSLIVTSLDNNVTKTVTIDVQPVSLSSFALSGAPLNLTTNGLPGTVTANTFIGTDSQPFPGSVTVTWTETGDTGGNTVTKGGTTYEVNPNGSPANWTVVASAGGIDQPSFSVSVIAWPAALLLSNAAKNISGTDDTNPAENWTGATNGATSGTTYSSWQTGGTAPATEKNLMVSQYVYAGTAASPVSVQSTTAGSNNYTAAVTTMSTLVNGIDWENAVKLCANSTEGGYTDWYLPNSIEIDALYNAKLLGWSNISSRTNVYYWSSTEYSANDAWYRHFTSSSTYTNYSNKTYTSGTNYTWVARCVRRTN